MIGRISAWVWVLMFYISTLLFELPTSHLSARSYGKFSYLLVFNLPRFYLNSPLPTSLLGLTENSPTYLSSTFILCHDSPRAAKEMKRCFPTPSP